MISEYLPVLKASTSSLLAISILAVLAGCAKKDGGDAASTAAPTAAPPAAATATAPTMPEGMGHPEAKPSAEVDLAGIAKAEGGKTVAEVFAEKDKLSGQKVTVRGKVVKTNAGIMGKDWVHVRDGSGADGTNDLTATTNSGAAPLPNVGDLVLVTGTVALNKNLGMGYEYPVIVENAEVKAEAAAK
jgi:hypothetical protein